MVIFMDCSVINVRIIATAKPESVNRQALQVYLEGLEFSSIVRILREAHPFERLLVEMQMKHRYTKSCRPQTNGKT